jgi:cytochrome c oxidase subunit 1
MVSTIGSFTIALGVLFFLVNIVVSARRARTAAPVGADPWDARSLEWMIPSPVPEYNFVEIPTVTARDEFWTRKYGEDENGRVTRIAATEDVVEKPGATGIHLPSPSYWPIVLAAGLPFIAYGLIFSLWWAAVGGVIVIAAIYGWGLEPADDDENPHDHDDHDGNGAEADIEAAADDEDGAEAGERPTEEEAAPVG